MNIHELLAIDTAVTTAPVELGRDPKTDEPYGLMVVGQDSPQYRAEMDRQRFAGMADKRAANENQSSKIDMSTPEGYAVFQAKFQANLTAAAVAVTVDWYGFTDASGQPAPFDPAVAKQMLHARATWRDKVLAKTEHDDAFLPQPAKDSGSTAPSTPGSSPSEKPQKGKNLAAARKS